MYNQIEQEYKDDKNVAVMRVSHSSEPKLIATAILKSLDSGKRVSLLSMGSAISVGTKAIGLVELFNNGSRKICYKPIIEKIEGTQAINDVVTVINFMIWIDDSEEYNEETMNYPENKEIVMHYVPNNDELIRKDIENSTNRNLTFLNGIPIVRDGATRYVYLFYRNNLYFK